LASVHRAVHVHADLHRRSREQATGVGHGDGWSGRHGHAGHPIQVDDFSDRCPGQVSQEDAAAKTRRFNRGEPCRSQPVRGRHCCIGREEDRTTTCLRTWAHARPRRQGCDVASDEGVLGGIGWFGNGSDGILQRPFQDRAGTSRYPCPTVGTCVSERGEANSRGSWTFWAGVPRSSRTQRRSQRRRRDEGNGGWGDLRVDAVRRACGRGP
jgi:hypothetical protein